MERILRVLHVEDSASDAGLVVRALEKAGYTVHSERVEDGAEMRAALMSREWDVVLADYHLPSFDAERALAVLRECELDQPFIVVSGAIGEDVAVALMRAGAHDYVLKHNLTRLAAAIEREIGEARIRRDRKEATEALRQSEERFRTAFENAAIGMALLTSDGRFSAVNDVLCEILGYPRTELTGKHFDEITHPDDQDASADLVDRMTSGALPRAVIEKRYIRKDGGLVWAHVLSAPLHDAAGAPAGFITQIQDITEHKLWEQALQEGEARERARATELQALMDAAPVALLISRDPECRSIFGNRKMYELLRLPPGGDLAAQTAVRMMRDGAEIPPYDVPLRLAIRGGPVQDYEFELMFEDGTSRQMFGNAVPVLDDAGNPCGAVAGFVDVTGRKLAEERLRQSQKMESIAQLAGGVAHDFNNILTAVSGNIALAMEELSPRSEAKELLESAVECVGRAAGLTKQLVAYAGKGSFVRAPVCATEVARKAVQLLQASAPEKIDLRLDLAPNLPPVIMDPSQMEQIFLNLIVNGMEAIGERQPGVVTVSTRHDDGWVRMGVCDDGCGMDMATQKRMFEPFFSTRFTGRGLGLAAVDGIVRALKGEILVESALGRGTRIQVLLPAASASHPDPKPREAPAQSVASRGVVLIVEDEPQVRKLAAAILKRHGFEALEASSRTALTILTARGAEIEAILVDLSFAEHGTCFDEIIRLRGDVPLILSSAYPEAEMKRQFGGVENVRGFVTKPYTGEQLLAQILPTITTHAP